MTPTPTDHDLFILIGPDDSNGREISAAMASWARAELLRPFYWLAAQDVPTSGVVAGRRINHTGDTEVSLPQDLGRSRWTRCQLLVVQPTSREAPGGPGLGAFADKYARFLERTVLPMGLPLLRVNMIVPTSDMTEVSGSLLIDGWDETLIVSPEERASTNHANVLVLAGGGLTGHAAVAAASAAGLWAGMEGLPLLPLLSESGSGNASPRLMRTFARAVLGGEVTHNIAEVALTPRDGKWRVPSSKGGQPLAVAQDPQGLIEDTIQELDKIDRGALEYATLPTALVPEKLRVGWREIWAVFKEFWAILFRRVTDIPGRMRSAAERRISKKVFGEEGAHEFGWDVQEIQGRVGQLVELRDPDGFAENETIFDQARRADRALALLGREQRPEAARAQAWIELRQLCLGLADGGALPAEIALPTAGAARQVINDPICLVPNSEEPRFHLPDDLCAAHESLAHYRGLILPPCDPLLTARLDRDLDQVRAIYSGEAETHLSFAQTKESEASALRQKAAEAKEAGDQAKEQPAALNARAANAEMEAAKAHERAKNARLWADRLDEVEQQLTTWAEPRLPTLLWRVGESIGRNLDNASIDQHQALGAISAAPDLDVKSIEKARKRVVRSLWFWLIAAIAGATAGVILLHWTWAPLLAVVLFLIVISASFIRYTQKRSACEWRFATASAEQVNALNRLVHAAREVSRLSVLYRLYVEWAEILGYQAHTPWIPDEESLARPPVAEFETDNLPSALVVGTSEVPDDNLASLGAQAARDLQQEGWLLNGYRDSRDFSMVRLADQEGRSTDDLDPDRDAPTDPTGARAFLLDDLRDHLPQQAAYRSAVTDIGAFCSNLPPDKLFRSVSLSGEERAINDFLAELVPEEDAEVPGFPVGILSPQARVQGAYEVDATYLWAPNGIGSAPAVRHLPVPTTRSGQYLLQAVRIDLTQPLSPAEFAIFDLESATPDSSAPAPSDDW